MADTFGLKIGVEGEREFKKALSDINQSFKVLGSEMKLATSEFGKNETSVGSLTAKNEVLTKQIDAQKEKVETLRKALQNATNSFGESDRRTQAWAAQLNNARAELNGMERELSQNERAIDGMGNELKDAGEAAEKASSKYDKLTGVLKGVGVALGVVAAAAGAAAVKLGKEVTAAFGELEQNLGGSEAVFGQYASKIQKSGEEAYKNLGLSQSDYLATANKMGALFQGSGLSQQRSLELTTKAMQRAADMASVMGIDMESAMESVAGAAKGNFTMMDNLGVAMNATNIEAYALAKGMDFCWNKATQAEKAEVAMEMFLTNTAQYAGNFARESTETISGSIGLLSASWSSFIAGLGNSGADMRNLTENVADAFQAVVKNITPVIENLVGALPVAMDGLLGALAELLPTLLATIATLFEQVLSTIMSLLPELIPAVVQAVLTITDALVANLPRLVDAAVQAVVAMATGLGDALPRLVPAIVEAVALICQTLFANMDKVLAAALALIQGLADGLIAALPVLIEALPAVITGIVGFLAGSAPQIIEAGINLFMSLIAALPDIIVAIVEALPQIIAGIVSGLMAGLPQMAQAGAGLFMALVQTLPEAIEFILMALPQIVTAIVENLVTFFEQIAVAGYNFFSSLTQYLPDAIVNIANAVPQIISAIVSAFNEGVGVMTDIGANLVRGLWNGIQSLTSWLWEKVSAWVKSIWDGICDYFGISSPSKEMGWIGEMLVEGLAGSIGDNAKDAVNAVTDMGSDIDGVMRGVAEDMETSLPTDFNTNINGSLSGAEGTGASGSAFNVTIPLAIDGRLLTQIISQIQWSQNKAVVRNLGIA